jgi:hypothetical protein
MSGEGCMSADETDRGASGSGREIEQERGISVNDPLLTDEFGVRTH